MQACVAVIHNYQQKFAELFEYLAASNNVNNDMYHEQDVFEVNFLDVLYLPCNSPNNLVSQQSEIKANPLFICST